MGVAVLESIVPRDQVGEGEDLRVFRNFLLPQRSLHLLPVPSHDLVIIRALWPGTREEEK